LREKGLLAPPPPASRENICNFCCISGYASISGPGGRPARIRSRRNAPGTASGVRPLTGVLGRRVLHPAFDRV